MNVDPYAQLLGAFADKDQAFGTILVDPPWNFKNSTGKMAPEHKRLHRYTTMPLGAIKALPVEQLAEEKSHLYLWTPNALLAEALDVMKGWGFTYKTHLVWYKIRKDGGPDGRGVGFYFRNVTELVLFGVKGKLRTLQPGRTQVNILASRKREHSRKPDELYDVIEDCSPGPYLELFARHARDGWWQWGDEVSDTQAEPEESLMKSEHNDPPLTPDQSKNHYGNTGTDVRPRLFERGGTFKIDKEPS